MTQKQLLLEELDRLSSLVKIGVPGAKEKRAQVLAELAAVGLRENGNSVSFVTPDLIPGTLQEAEIEITGAVVGTQQVETATVVGTITETGAGDATVTVTGTAITGSPLAITVAVANDDTAEVVAGKIRAELGATAAITDVYTVSGEGADIVLTEIGMAGDDETLNIAIDNGTCTGLTAAPTSVDTTAGVADGSGNAALTVTAANVAGSPLSLTVAVEVGDDADAIAGKVADKLLDTAAFVEEFTTEVVGNKITIVAKNYHGNDATLKLAIEDGTSNGVGTEVSTITVEGEISGSSLVVTTGCVFASGDEEGLTLILPVASLTPGQTITVVKTDSGDGDITITPSEGDTISGASSFVLDAQYEAAVFRSSGVDWFIVSKITI
jgi:hypothetical protein